jgi:signal transduction histidine kinase
MREKPTGLLLAVVSERSYSLISRAAAQFFPTWTTVPIREIDDACNQSPSGVLEVLIIEGRDGADIQKAVRATDAAGLPRWPVVALGDADQVAGALSLPRARNGAEALANTIEFAILHHQLRRDHARSIGDLCTVAGRFAHDIRSPLGCVRISAEMITESFTGADSAAIDAARRIIDSADEIMALLDRVSFVLKASANPACPELVDMSDVFHRALSAIEPELAASGTTVEPPRDWPEVRGVPAHIEAVWTNLLMNAARHGGGAPHIEAGWHRNNGELRFWIRDDGPGVPSNRRSHLFRPFHQLHDSQRTLGIGLSLVQRLVDLNGGRCGYEPAPSGGSRFWFSLPEARTCLSSEGAHGAIPRVEARTVSQSGKRSDW